MDFLFQKFAKQIFDIYGGKNKWENFTEVQEGTSIGVLEILDQDRCINQLAQNAVKNAKFHSSQQKASQFTVENAIEKKEDFNSLSIDKFT